MITNFEEITKPLTQAEIEIVNILIDILNRTNKKNPIKAPQLVELIILESSIKKFGQARLRKIINYLRGNGILPIIATSKGYYLSNETTIIEGEIKSLNERADAIRFASHGLKRFLVKSEQLKLVL